MEKWDGTVLDINSTVERLGDCCGTLLGLHAMSGCDTVSYPYVKGKASALDILQDSSIAGLDKTLGEKNATENSLKKIGTSFFLALYGQGKQKGSRSLWQMQDRTSFGRRKNLQNLRPFPQQKPM